MDACSNEFVLGRVGRITIAVPSARVHSIIREHAADELASAGELSPVMAVIGGVGYSLYDARSAVNLSARSAGQKREILVIDCGMKLGIVFDEVIGTVVCAHAMHDAKAAVKLPRYPFISDVCEHNGETVLLLDIDAVTEAMRTSALPLVELYQQNAV